MTLASVLVATVWLRFGSQNFWATGRRRDLQWVPCDTRELLFVQFVGNILVKSLRSHLLNFIWCPPSNNLEEPLIFMADVASPGTLFLRESTVDLRVATCEL